MNRTRVVRLLRIGTSAVCVVACVLLIALWVRSNWRIEGFSGNRGQHYDSVAILDGEFHFSRTPRNEDGIMPWRVFPDTLTKFDAEAIRNNIKLNRRTLGVGWHGFAGFDYGWQASVSLWLPTLISAAIAAAPWLRWRFSLRTLLIGMTVVAAVLGIIAVSK